MINSRIILLAIVLGGIAAAIFYLESRKPPRSTGGRTAEIAPPGTFATKERQAARAEKSKQYPAANEIVSPDGFINTDSISVSELVGKKVVLIDFWTYSGINCQRTIPYLNAWYEKYSDQGLEIIGVHTPEFRFEQKYQNVAAAVKKFSVRYPVVLDNQRATWNAYNNRYWPQKYLVDIDGFIVFEHIGEGGYAETERKIQQLLEERMAALGNQMAIAKEIARPKGAPEVDFSKVESPEIYFGAARNRFLANGRPEQPGRQALKEPPKIAANQLYLVGDWDFQDEFAENKSGNAKIIFRYRAKDVYLVANSENGVEVKILRDGKVPVAGAEQDVARDGSGSVHIREDRLYRLIEDTGYGEHTLEIIVNNPGLRAFTFTFG